MQRPLASLASFFLFASLGACGSGVECGDELVLRDGRCVCPEATHWVCDETSMCTCEPLDAGLPDAGPPSDGGAGSDGGCTAAGEMICGGTCVDTSTSADHCGACDTPCAAPDQCVAGECRDPIVHASGGNTHTCAVHASGRVSCWGNNEDGQLGDGSFEQRLTPRFVLGIDDAARVAAHGYYVAGGSGGYSCALRSTGLVSCWGNAFLLGTGDTGASNVPLDAMVVDRAVDLDVGSGHACAVRSDGHVLCWGSNSNGQLGVSTGTTYSATPVVVGGVGGISNARSVAVAGTTTCAVLMDSTVACWGNGETGALGDGTTPSARHVPGPVSGLTGAVEIAAGLGHFCTRLGTAEVACWGWARMLGIGVSDTMSIRSTPVLVGGIDDAVDLDVDGGLSCVVRASGEITCWGIDPVEGARTGASTPAPLPIAVDAFVHATDLAVGGGHLCAFDDGGELECLGRNSWGQLGDGTTEDRTSPVTVRDPI